MRLPERDALAEHGGPRRDELRAAGIDPAALLDFSVNVNPYGPCAAVLRAIREAPVDRYPDPTALAAREALGRASAVPADHVVVGNGAADLLWTIARTFVRPAERALVVEPAFAELRRALQAGGAVIAEWRADAEHRFAIDGAAVARFAAELRPALVSVCTPCSPTGAWLSAAELCALAAAAPQATVVVDESFLALSDRADDAGVALPANVIRVRSLTKDHAIPGVRVGYALASPERAARLEAARPAWTTSALAEAAAVAASRQWAFVADSRRRLAADREALAGALRGLGLGPVPSVAPFLLVEVGDASALRARLLARHGILVRDAGSFGLPRFVRLAARPAADVERLVAALRAELAR